MKPRSLFSLIASTLVLVCAGNAVADVATVTINSPTSGSPEEVSAGLSFGVGISYTTNGLGASTVDLGIKLLSGSTVVGSTNITVANQVGTTTTNLTFGVTNCTLNGIYDLVVDATDGNTISATNSAAVYIIEGKPANFSVTGGGAFCSGGSGAVVGLSGSEIGVTYQLKKGIFNKGSQVGDGNPINFGYQTSVGTYTVVATSPGFGCSATMTGNAIVSTTPASVGGTATPTDATICSGLSTTITLTGETGSIAKWQSSTNNGDNWTDIVSADNPLDTGVLTNTTYFQAVVTNGSCASAISGEAIVTVNPPTVGGTATATASAVCSGSSTAITLAGQTGSIVRWETSPDGSTWTTNATTSNPLNTGNLTATKHFRAVVGSGLCSQSNSVAAVVTVSPATVGGTATPTDATLCSGDATTINLSGQTGSIVRWESSTDDWGTWTTNASTANPLVTDNLTVTTQFRAKVLSGGCTTLDSSAATVTVNPVSVGGTATPAVATLCSGSSTTITLTGQTGSIVRWETSPDGSTWTTNATTSNPLNTGNLTATKHFRAVVGSGLCSQSNSVAAVVTVSPATVGGTATPTDATICSGSSTTINLSGQTGSVVRWESSTDDWATWTTNASTATSLSTGNLTVTTQFRAKVLSGGCTTLDSSAATVTVNPVSVGGTATPTVATLCSGSSTTITLTGQTGSIVKWQSSTNGTDWTDILTTANPLNTGTLTVTNYFRAVVQSGACSTANSSEAVVTVNPPPSITGQPSSAIKLVGGSVTFSVTASHATGYQWRTNGTPISGATSSTYTINPVGVTDALSYDCVVSGDSPCATTTSAAATLTVGSKLVFSSEPVNTAAGATMADVAVQIQDASGNATAVSGVSVSLTLNGGGTLAGTASVNTDADGKATFSGLSIVRAAAGYTFTASSGSLTAATSSSFTITAVAASAYCITAATPVPAPGVGDVLTLKLVDQFTNTVTTFNGDKNLTFSGLAVANNGTTHPTITDKTGAAVNLGTVTIITFASGQSSLGGSLIAYRAEGPVTLAATDGTLSTTTSGGAGVSLTISNAAPVAVTDSATRARGTSLKILRTILLSNDTDANHDSLTFVGVDSSSTNGATIMSDATYVYYLPPVANPNAADRITYTNTDGLLQSAGYVFVSILDPTGQSQNIAIGVDTNNSPELTVFGIPDYEYDIERGTNTIGPWTFRTNVTLPNAGDFIGRFKWTDVEVTNGTYFYRTKLH